MTLLQHLKKDLKIFFFIVAVKSLLRGIPLEVFRKNVEGLKSFENHQKFKEIHQKLIDKKIITTQELEFLIEYERKRQWEKG